MAQKPDSQLLSQIEYKLRTHDLRWMFLRIYFPNQMPRMQLEGTSSDCAMSIYSELEKSNMLDDLSAKLHVI